MSRERETTAGTPSGPKRIGVSLLRNHFSLPATTARISFAKGLCRSMVALQFPMIFSAWSDDKKSLTLRPITGAFPHPSLLAASRLANRIVPCPSIMARLSLMDSTTARYCSTPSGRFFEAIFGASVLCSLFSSLATYKAVRKTVFRSRLWKGSNKKPAGSSEADRSTRSISASPTRKITGTPHSSFRRPAISTPFILPERAISTMTRSGPVCATSSGICSPAAVCPQTMHPRSCRPVMRAAAKEGSAATIILTPNKFDLFGINISGFFPMNRIRVGNEALMKLDCSLRIYRRPQFLSSFKRQ